MKIAVFTDRIERVPGHERYEIVQHMLQLAVPTAINTKNIAVMLLEAQVRM